MPLGLMSAGSARDRQDRRQNEEAEPFLVQQIPGSPVVRGRRQRFSEERFLVEDIPGSPLMRGRVPRVMPATMDSADDAGLNSTTDTVDGTIRTMPPGPPLSSSNSYAGGSANHSRPADNGDAPPSYESSIPPATIGWSTELTTTTPFPMPHLSGYNDGIPSCTLPYPLCNAYPTIGLSPIAESYHSVESSMSKLPMRSTSPSLCPSPDRSRPAYTYQMPLAERISPPRPRYRFEHDVSPTKPGNDFSYKYGAILIALAFVAFLMLLSLAVKFLIRNGLNR